MELTTQRLQLRTLGPDYASLVLEFYQRNRIFLEPWSPTFKEEDFTILAWRQRLTTAATQREQGQAMRFWLFKKGVGQILGQVSLSNIVRGPFQSCFVGYELDGQQINQGYMTEALTAVVDYGFAELKLHRLEANIMPHNLPSIRVVEKLGFVCEGFSPKYLKIQGAWQGHYHYVLLNEAL